MRLVQLHTQTPKKWRLNDLLSKNCLPDIPGQGASAQTLHPFPEADRHLLNLSKSEEETVSPTSAQHSWAPQSPPPRTMGRGFRPGRLQDGREAGPQAGQRKADTQCIGRETAWPSRAELWTHCRSQGQVTSPRGHLCLKGKEPGKVVSQP